VRQFPVQLSDSKFNTVLEKEEAMVRPLSEQLADLSVRAKNAEDAVKLAKTEAHEKVVARREQSRAAVTAAIDKVDQDIKSVGTTASKNWAALQAKVVSDLETFKAGIEERKRDRAIKRAENYAERLEDEAAFSIDYAISAVEQAKLAVLDAIVGRVEAEQAKAS
jgi:hypothetical protein